VHCVQAMRPTNQEQQPCRRIRVCCLLCQCFSTIVLLCLHQQFLVAHTIKYFTTGIDSADDDADGGGGDGDDDDDDDFLLVCYFN